MAVATPEPIEAVPGLPDPDDLPDTVQTPPEATAPLPGPTLHQVRDDLRNLARVFDGGLERLPVLLERQGQTLAALVVAQLTTTLSPVEAGALQHLTDVLEAVQRGGLAITGAPYQATVEGRTPGGFHVSVSIQRTDGAAFLDSLGKLEAWLLSQNYTPAP